jgi:radical SAM protein with 4Fe4S-binding SPASM domain
MENLKADLMPNILRLELTNTCNLKCPHCRHHSDEKRNSPEYPEYYRVGFHMTREQVKSIFDEIGPYKPSVTLNAANEPMIAEQFRFAVEQVKKHGCSGTFNTNGLLLNKSNCEFLVEQKYDSVNISIDATTPETLKKARGITALDKLIRNVKLLHEIRGDNLFPRIGVTFVVMPYNENEIQDFLNFWKDIADVIRLTGLITDKKPDMSVLPGFKNYKVPARIACKQVFRDIVVRANGDVTPCVITSETPEYLSMGNIFKDGGIKAVWNGATYQDWRYKHNAGKWNEISYCKNCDYWVESFDFKEKIFDDFIIRSPSPYTVFYNVKSKFGNWDQESLIDRQGFGDKKVGTMDSVTSFDI